MRVADLELVEDAKRARSLVAEAVTRARITIDASLALQDWLRRRGRASGDVETVPHREMPWRARVLRRVLADELRCDIRWLRTLHSDASLMGVPVAPGGIEDFELHGHPTARGCIAWRVAGPSRDPQWITVLYGPRASGPSAVGTVLRISTNDRPSRAVDADSPPS